MRMGIKGFWIWKWGKKKIRYLRGAHDRLGAGSSDTVVAGKSGLKTTTEAVAVDRSNNGPFFDNSNKVRIKKKSKLWRCKRQCTCRPWP